MTENMAGRGEGLAGLTEGQIRVIVYDALKNQFPAEGAAMMVASCCAEPIRRALEAAAPAGTPDTECEYCDGLASVCVECYAKALATPSPQAPTCICGASSIFPKISCPVHGLQEPAGSGASELKPGICYHEIGGATNANRNEVTVAARHKRDLSGHDLCPICGHSHSEWGAAVAAMHESPSTLGSPRKVGEDGAKVGDDVLLRGKVRYFCESDDTVGVKIDGAMTVTVPREALARSSSAPVGEQKQEEGV